MKKTEAMIAVMATIPERVEGAAKAINSIAGQVDYIYVSLNIEEKTYFSYVLEVTNKLESLIHEPYRKKVLITRRYNELGDAERYFHVDDDWAYYFSIDDDLVYPDDYVNKMLDGMDMYDVPVTLHGKRYMKEKVTSYYKDYLNVKVYHCLGSVVNDVSVHVPGTGVMAWCSDTLDLSYNHFKEKNMADIEVARIAWEQGIKEFKVLAHGSDYLEYTAPEKGTTIFEIESKDDRRQTEAINKHLKNIFKSNRRTLSISMIVKNEELLLERCLKSVEGADEIVIVDTGSSDNTVEVGKKYTDKVYTDYKWADRFDEARNESLKRCTGDYVYIIDADEYLGEGEIEKLKEYIQTLDESIDGVYINVIGEGGSDEGDSLRLFKRKDAIRWQGWIHNYIVGTTKVAYNHQIKHTFGYSPAHSNDPERTKRICIAYLEEHPDAARERYYLAREYYYEGDYIQCLKELEIYYTKPNNNPAELADGYLMAARCYLATGDSLGAREKALKAISINSEFAEAYWVVYQTYNGTKEGEKWREMSLNASNEGVLFKRKLSMPTATVKYDGWEHTFHSRYQQDHIFKILKYRNEFYELDLLEKIKSMNLGGIYVDIGAHIGNHTVFFAVHCKSTKVISYEIRKESFKDLIKNVEGCPNVEIYNMGIGSRYATVYMNEINPLNTGMSKIVKDDYLYEDHHIVDDDYYVDSLDSRFEEEEYIAFIKIDVEDYHTQVIDGMSRILKEQAPVLAIELATKEEFDFACDKLSRYGYITDGIAYAYTPTYIFTKHNN